MIDFDPAFRLIDAFGTRAVAELPPAGPVVKVAVCGSAGVVAALCGEQEKVCLVRDQAVVMPENMEAGLWLQTSGTTGAPKWVRHDPQSLWARVAAGREKARWLLTYHPASFAGVQVILAALKGGHELVSAPVGAGVAELAQWAVKYQVTHISGTPTFWRAFMMALTQDIPLKAVTLGGETADQAILDTIRSKFPKSLIRHIYATTETGVVFTVTDAREGFPAQWLENNEWLSLSPDDTLCVNGIDTGDVIAIEGDRALFRGRVDTVVNIGGSKVFPEAVEAFLVRHPMVREARVGARPSPLTGHVLVAEIVVSGDAEEAERAVKAHLAQLPRPQRPVTIRMVEALELTQTGKKARVP